MKKFKLNSKKIAIKQFIAFVIDLAIVSLPLILMTNFTGFAIFTFLWFFYIPTAELVYGQTFGMKMVGTKIYASMATLSKITLGVALRRHIARISIVWGVFGWVFMLFGKQLFKDYTIVCEEYFSNDGTLEYANHIKNMKKNLYLDFL